MSYGVIQVMPVEAYCDPDFRLSQEDRVERRAYIYRDEPPRPQTVGDWPKVQIALHRGDVYVIETTTPAFTATLSFCPDRPDSGRYEIHPKPRGRVELGRTEKVTAVPADETETLVSLLTPFAIRYAVVTVASERPHARKIWFVGLNDVKNVDETEDLANQDT
jgi:hypothetical protein